MTKLCLFLTPLFLLTVVQRSQNTTDDSPFLNITGNTTYKAEPGENVTLLCKFPDAPSMELHHLTIRWTKDSSTIWLCNRTSKIPPGGLVRQEDLHKDNANLQLSQVQKKDSGTYACTITYRRMERSQISILTVEDPDVWKPDLQDFPQKATALPSNITHDKYRAVKMGLLMGVLATTYCFSFFIYFCVSV